MMRAIKSSWWVNLPGLLAIAAMIALMAARRPWPASAPVHFNFNWKADRWGSPWEFSVFPVLASGVTIAGICVSAIWAKHENGKKHFNLTLPLIVTPLGAMAGVHFWFWSNLSALAKSENAPGAWIWVISCAAIICVASGILETFRKAIPDDDDPTASEKSETEMQAEREIQRQLPPNARWIYFSSQQAGPLRWMIAGFGIPINGLGIWLFQLRVPVFSAISLICSGAIVFALSAALGSMRIQVNTRQLVLRAGPVGIRLLRLNLSDITGVRVVDTSGGWGLRYAGNTWVYIMRGNRGVRLETRAGKGYVIGSPEPEKLTAAIRLESNQHSTSQ